MEPEGDPVLVDRAVGIAQLKQSSAQGEARLLGVGFDVQGLASLAQGLQQTERVGAAGVVAAPAARKCSVGSGSTRMPSWGRLQPARARADRLRAILPEPLRLSQPGRALLARAPRGVGRKPSLSIIAATLRWRHDART